VRRQRPLLAERLLRPPKTKIDRTLVLGSSLFGIGWGLAGLCPGPAIENLASLSPRVIVFVFAMIAGTILIDRAKGRAPSATAIENAALARSDG